MAFLALRKPFVFSAQAAGRTVLFLDDFNGGALDASKWYKSTPDDGDSLSGNSEKQCYTAAQTTVANGQLKLTAISQSTDGTIVLFPGGVPTPTAHTFAYASGMIQCSHAPDPTQALKGTAGKFQFTYGYIETRVNIPAGKGFWPAFWLFTASGAWPPEIDIFEILGDLPTRAYMTVHWDAGGHQSDTTTYDGPDFSVGPHVFGLEWQSNAMTWYIDGVARKSFTDSAHIPSVPMNIEMNLAVGGTFPGDPDGSTVFPSVMTADYILVVQ